MKIVIVNVNLEFMFDVATDEEAKTLVQDAELPDNYMSDSFEIVKVITE